MPYVFAVTTGFQLLAFISDNAIIGLDARLYTSAARAWLNGADPWRSADLGVFFAAPPPTLLLYAPFTFLPDSLVTAIWVVGSFVIAAVALRSMGAPMWWLISWPIVDGALIGNANVVVFAFLVLLRGRLAPVAALLKIYALAPMIGERRWRLVALATAIVGVSAVVLPWRTYLAEGPMITEHLAAVSATTSVFGQPVVMAIAAVALISLGFRRAGWLVVPVLWPYTQPHYLAMSIPAMSPVLALAWSFPHPWIVAGTVVLEAFLVATGRYRDPAPRRTLA